MMNNENAVFLDGVRRRIGEGVEKMRKADEELERFEKTKRRLLNGERVEILGNVVTLEGVARNIKNAEEQREKAKREAMDDVMNMVQKRKKILSNRQRLDPVFLNNEDYRLLNSGISITADELTAMYDRHTVNDTMMRYILDYADSHGIKIDRYYTPTQDMYIQMIETIPDAMEVALRHYTSDDALNRLFDDNSNLGVGLDVAKGL